MLFTTVNKRIWCIELVDQLTAPVGCLSDPAWTKTRPYQLIPNFPVRSNNATWIRKSEQADPPETLTNKWLAARHALIGPQYIEKFLIFYRLFLRIPFYEYTYPNPPQRN